MKYLLLLLVLLHTSFAEAKDLSENEVECSHTAGIDLKQEAVIITYSVGHELSARYCQLKENSTLSIQFAWRESIDLSRIMLCAPHVRTAKSGLS